MKRSSKIRLTAALLALGLVAAACGDSKSSNSSSGGGGDTAATTTTKATDKLAAIGINSSKCPKGNETKGVSADKILVGISLPKSGPYAAFGNLSEGMKGYFDYANAELGGVDGKKLELVVKDDAYEPTKTVNNVNELIERDGVFVTSGILGTANNLAVRDTLNQDCIPHLFPSTGAPEWGDVAGYPWTVAGAVIPYNLEARLWVDYITKTFPDGATVAMLATDNDFGKTYETFFTQYAKGTKINLVKVERHDPTAPNVTNQMTTLAATNAQVVIGGVTATYCTQFLKALGDNPTWKPTKLVSGTCKSAVYFAPAGPGASGAIVAAAGKDLPDPVYDADKDVVAARANLKKYAPNAPLAISLVGTGYLYGEILRDVLLRASKLEGGLTRPNVMLAARSTEIASGLLLDGVKFKLSGTTDPYPIESARLENWNGATFVKLTDVVSYEGQIKLKN